MLSKGTQVPKAWVSCTQVPSPLQLPPTLRNLPPTVEGVTSWDGCPSQDPVHTRVPRDPRCQSKNPVLAQNGISFPQLLANQGT